MQVLVFIKHLSKIMTSSNQIENNLSHVLERLNNEGGIFDKKNEEIIIKYTLC